MKVRIVEETPADHVLLRTHGRPYFAVPASLFVDDLETRMRSILEHLTTEDGVTEEGVMEDIFLDDEAAPVILGDDDKKDYYRIHGDLEDELEL